MNAREIQLDMGQRSAGSVRERGGEEGGDGNSPPLL